MHVDNFASPEICVIHSQCAFSNKPCFLANYLIAHSVLFFSEKVEGKKGRLKINNMGGGEELKLA